VMVGSVCLRLSKLLLGVGACFGLVETSERLLTWTTGDVWFGTIRESSVKNVWRVDQVFFLQGVY
jgi:hypothetical protein